MTHKFFHKADNRIDMASEDDVGDLCCPEIFGYIESKMEGVLPFGWDKTSRSSETALRLNQNPTGGTWRKRNFASPSGIKERVFVDKGRARG